MDFKICSLSSHVSSLNFYVKLFYFKAFFLVVSLDIRSQAALYQKLKKKKKKGLREGLLEGAFTRRKDFHKFCIPDKKMTMM